MPAAAIPPAAGLSSHPVSHTVFLHPPSRQPLSRMTLRTVDHIIAMHFAHPAAHPAPETNIRGQVRSVHPPYNGVHRQALSNHHATTIPKHFPANPLASFNFVTYQICNPPLDASSYHCSSAQSSGPEHPSSKAPNGKSSNQIMTPVQASFSPDHPRATFFASPRASRRSIVSSVPLGPNLAPAMDSNSAANALDGDSSEFRSALS